MKTLVVYSSLTGNTKQVAEAIFGEIAGEKVLLQAGEEFDPADFDLIFAGFWADKGTADPAAQEVLKGLARSRVALFCTLGAYPNSPHANDCLARAAELLPKDSIVAGSFHCHGKIDAALIKRLENLPSEHSHALTPERQARHAAAATHPDEADLAAAAAFAREITASW